MPYNTGNPVGSTDPRDLFDNAGILDKFANEADPFYPDRFAVQRLSLDGMRYNFQQSLTGWGAAFQQFLLNSGYEAPIAYGAGATLERSTSTFVRDDILYRIQDPANLPYTLTGNWASESDNFVAIGDGSLRQELAASAGAELIGYGSGTVADALASTGTVTSYPEYSPAPNADNSAAAAAMIAATNTLIVAAGETLIAKNLLLPSGCRVLIAGRLKLPNGCSDFDRLLRSEPGTSGLFIDIAEIDGNAANQSGDIGTHFVYLNQPVNHFLHVRYAHDHYASTGSAPSPDGVRDSSSGAIFVYKPTGGSTLVGYLKQWGREGVQIREGMFSQGQLTYGEGHEIGGNEYSGIQMSGYAHILKDSKVRWAGASGIGFDVTNGIAGHLVSIDSKENHGLNCGHTGFPATDSVISSVVVDGAFVHGISVGAGTQRLTIGNISVSNCGESCLNVSDNAGNVKASNGFARYAGVSNANAYLGLLELSGVDLSALDARVLRVQVTSGRFVTGEDITVSGGGAGTVRRVISNRSGNFQILFLSSRSGSSAAGLAVAGSTSGASGTVANDYGPVRTAESTGGKVVEDIKFNDDGGLGVTLKFSDGTVIHTAVVQLTATANTLATQSQNYPSAAAFISPPFVTGSLNSSDSTDSFDLSRLSVTGSTSAITVKLKASVAQNYAVTVQSRGRWKV